MRRKLKVKGGPYNGETMWLPFPKTANFTVSRIVDHHWRGLTIERYKETYTGHYRLIDEKGSPRDEVEWCQKSFVRVRLPLH